ncbi:MAG: GNAT family N-acetyltransferase [Campylobacterota bacterium]|nr:GNAT family N-acetyltransferase [Campylobacterota bacterium]
MKNSITLKIPNELGNCPIVVATISTFCKKVKFGKGSCKELINAAKLLIHNAVIHAYPDQEGWIEISLHSFGHGIRIDVRDWGVPMAKSTFASPDSNQYTETGFDLVHKLVDSFHYKNLGKKGKVFTIIKRTSFPLSVCKPIRRKSDPLTGRDKQNILITIRDFQKGDEESIARLVYQNYGLSFAKEDFYYPVRILEKQGEKFLSIVALYEDEVIGHFALILMPDSNIAEVGIVVVNPDYKGLGTMNRMFDALIEKAEEIKLNAIFGSAVMYHIYSQKSNLSYGFCESALLIGKTLDSVHIEGNKLTEKRERGSTLIGYLFFNNRKRLLFLPKHYQERIITCYKHCGVSYSVEAKSEDGTPIHSHLLYRYDPLSNIGEIIINRYGKDFKYKFRLLLNQLREKQCDMIYADINLEQIPQIDKVIKLLNDSNFFYSGILYFKHNDQDYLRLQNRNSDKIGKSNLVCYSEYCTTLLDYIRKDEGRIKRG